ncbi:MAG: NapH/MauN family ferredoxin-type protein [Pseudomonadota bacterium]|nr:NapH/MauN family ferredoxin-type protein [Pseudomonadota bacterium]MDP1904576.1 NapH/MauN family ferredoxin-type protein [Pseudomonadota bacterium]MDP2353225.1 NapH/MauN family ferredoxin-type protein [Pseudomonadota bacterium]
MSLRESARLLLGGEVRKPAPEDYTPGARQVHELKRMDVEHQRQLKEHAKLGHPHRNRWRNRRWAVLIAVNLLFVFSFWLDIQILEGALTASRFLGFHLIDLNSALQVMLAHKHILVNLVIGTATVFVLWVLLGGRAFCSWVCPYHLLAEWAESLHLYLVKKKKVSDHAFHRGLRTVLWLLFAALAFATGYTVFETLSLTGILSRALIYGPGLGLLWVLFWLLLEVVYSRRAWCRYFCPIGLTYGAVGLATPLQVGYRLGNCFHEGDCRKVCLVPHVLECVIKGRATDEKMDIGADCTRCGLCVDVCPSGALNFEVKGLSKWL